MARGPLRCFGRRLLSPGVLALVLVAVAASYGLYVQQVSDDRDEWNTCVRSNEFRDTLDTTFRDVIAAAVAPRPDATPTEERMRKAQAKAVEQRLTEPLSKLQDTRRACGPEPQAFWSDW